MFPRRARPEVRRAHGRHACRAARVRHRAWLRGPERPRRASSRPGHGGSGGEARSLARRLRAGGGQIDAQPPGTVAPRRHALQEDRPRPGGHRAAVRRPLPRSARSGRPKIVLDLDATDDPLHGHQEGRFFHGYYDCYCYLPLYIFCGEHLLAAKLQAVEHRRQRGGGGGDRADRRADSGALAQDAHSLARRFRLRARGADGVVRTEPGRFRVRPRQERAAGRRNLRRTGAGRGGGEAHRQAARRFKDFRYATLDSWSRRARVIGKAEWTQGEANPRFIVTSLRKAGADGRLLYEKVYCARGEMENRIKECQGDLFADRTSTATMRANQLRLWFASFAYALLCALRRSASPIPSTPRRPAARSGSSSSSSPVSSASAPGASRSRSPRPVPTPTNGVSPQPASPEAPPRRRPKSRQSPQGPPETKHNRTQPAQTAHRARVSITHKRRGPTHAVIMARAV